MFLICGLIPSVVFLEIPMALQRSDVEKIAHLARLGLNEGELPRTTDALNSILGLVDQMQAVDTTGVEPLAHPLETTQRLRPDQVTESNQRDRYQAVAPSTENGLYLVPKVID
jgi:aspartyl-tRNA(Asn)/glutamyl-tRNA(Gln) amidotransferase subunit C